MLKKISEQAGYIQVIYVGGVALIGAVGGWVATLTFSVAPLESRVTTLEQKVKEVVPAATLKDEQCVKLIDLYPNAGDAFHEGRIKDALKMAGCKTEF